MRLHRLQISLHPGELEFLRAQARRERLSMAEVVRRLVGREAETMARGGNVESIWEIAGIGKETKPLIRGLAVSEYPDLYLAEAIQPSTNRTRKRAKKRRPKAKK